MRIVSDKLKLYWKRGRDFCVYKILHADDPPHQLALGVAVGLFVTFLPLIGFQMVCSVFLAWLLRANKLVGVPLVWISNPLTVIPIYYPCYWLGCQLLGMPAVSEEWNELKKQWMELQVAPSTTWGTKVSFWWSSLVDFMGPLGLGCLVVASSVGVVSYYVSLYAIRSYRMRRWGQLMPPRLTPKQDTQEPFGHAATADEDARNSTNPSSSEDNAA